MSDSKVIRSKKVNLSLGENLATQLFLFIDILLKLQQQILTCFCKF